MTETIQVDEKAEEAQAEGVQEQAEKKVEAQPEQKTQNQEESVMCPQVRATRARNERIRKMGDGVGVLSLYKDFD